MSKILNGEGRVFGCLSAAEQQELKDAAKMPGAVVAVWLDGGWDTDSNPFDDDAFAYLVTLPDAPVLTCPKCGGKLYQSLPSGKWLCSKHGCFWTQPDAVQRPKRPEPREGYHAGSEWRKLRLGDFWFSPEGTLFGPARAADCAYKERWIAVPDAVPTTDPSKESREQFYDGKLMNGEPAPIFTETAVGEFQPVPGPAKPEIHITSSFCEGCSNHVSKFCVVSLAFCKGCQGGSKNDKTKPSPAPEPVPVVPVVRYWTMTEHGCYPWFRKTIGEQWIELFRFDGAAWKYGTCQPGEIAVSSEITEKEYDMAYAAAKSHAHIRGVTEMVRAIEPLGNFPDMALMREKVNELVAWSSVVTDWMKSKGAV